MSVFSQRPNPTDAQLEEAWTRAYGDRPVAYPGSKADYANRVIYRLGVEDGKTAVHLDSYDHGFSDGARHIKTLQARALPTLRQQVSLSLRSLLHWFTQ